MSTPLYPINLSLDGRPVLLVGGGTVALHKARALVTSGAHVRVVAPTIVPELTSLAHALFARPFDAQRDLEGIQFVVAAATPEANAEATKSAHARGLFVLAVDQPQLGSAQSPAVLRRGGITVAISTDGAAPALAGLLRQALEALLPADADADHWIDLARRARESWKGKSIPHASRRPLLVEALVALYQRSPLAKDKDVRP
jgi:uroporphyrin-III C-methyltransferase / precorrin-2 dehydrogenase / sirohydrochlorin ferrochelatase